MNTYHPGDGALFRVLRNHTLHVGMTRRVKPRECRQGQGNTRNTAGPGLVSEGTAATWRPDGAGGRTYQVLRGCGLGREHAAVLGDASRHRPSYSQPLYSPHRRKSRASKPLMRSSAWEGSRGPDRTSRRHPAQTDKTAPTCLPSQYQETFALTQRGAATPSPGFIFSNFCCFPSPSLTSGWWALLYRGCKQRMGPNRTVQRASQRNECTPRHVMKTSIRSTCYHCRRCSVAETTMDTLTG